MNTRATKISLAVAIALSQLSFSQLAMADSVNEWGYWQDAPPVEQKEFNFAFNDYSSTDMDVLLDRTQAGTATSTGIQGDWIGYNLASPCYSTCADVNAPNKTNHVAGEMQLALNNSGVGTAGAPMELGNYPGTVAATGDFAGALLNFSAAANFFFADSQGAFVTEDTPGGYMGTKGPIIPGDMGALSAQGYMNINGSFDQMYIGRATPIVQMAQQLALGQTYFYGGYTALGGSVGMEVNFASATWGGEWSSSSQHNGFNASGNIAGNKITSTSVTGLGKSDGYLRVTGGQVDATFIGTFAGNDASKSAIIGKTVLLLDESRTVGDIFAVTLGGGPQ